MGGRPGGDWRSLVGWLAVPIVPAALADWCYRTMDFSGDDPREWGWLMGALLLGPLIGYGFLAGATAGLADEPGRGGWRSWPSRRAAWVTVGPWAGFLAVMAGLYAWGTVRDWLGWLIGPGAGGGGFPSEWAVLALMGTSGYGWVIVAGAALWRARRQGGLAAAIGRGMATAAGFVGSLLGSFWAATEAWRAYFFDPTIAGVILAAAASLMLTGCSGPTTVGEVRRRELFHALLMAWVIGLALLWRWRGRRRGGNPER